MTLLHFVLCGSKLSIPYGEDIIKQQQEQKLPFEVISRQLQCNHDMQMCYASLGPNGNSFFRTPIINHNNDRRMDIWTTTFREQRKEYSSVERYVFAMYEIPTTCLPPACRI